jgi:hypothetical protein
MCVCVHVYGRCVYLCMYVYDVNINVCLRMCIFLCEDGYACVCTSICMNIRTYVGG